MNLINENAEKPKSSPLWIGVGIVVIVLLAVIAASFYIEHKIASHRVSPNAQQVAPSSAIPQGLLFFSVLTKSTSTEQTSGVVSGVFDTSDGKAYDLQANKVSDGNAFTLQFSFSSDKQWVTFLAAPYVLDPQTHSASLQEAWGVYRAQVNGTSDRDVFTKILASSTALATSSSEDYFHEFPSITSDGAVAYSSLSESDFNTLQGKYNTANASLWSVFVIPPYGTKMKIGNGLHPKWVSATALAYMKDDGVYLYDTTTGSETLLLRSDVPLTIADGFDVSNDGTKLVLTEPSVGLVVYAPVTVSAGTSIEQPINKINMAASNPVFSPDGSYIALLTHDQDDTADDAFLQIKYLDTQSGAFAPKVSRLDASTIGGIYLTDWR